MNKHLYSHIKEKKNYELTFYLYNLLDYPLPLLFSIKVRARAVLNLCLNKVLYIYT